MQEIIGNVGDYVNVCCLCGCPLKLNEIAARLIGDIQDFEEKTPPQYAAIVFCSECKKKVLQYANDSVDTAVRRMRQMGDA